MVPTSAVIDGLNPEQRAAVLATDGPLVVLAGAGSGKTRVITHRVARIIEIGVPADRILAVTFTNKAAREMQSRVGRMTGRSGATVSTFHAFGARFLRSQAELIGRPATLSIFDRADSEATIKMCLEELGLDPDTFKPGDICEAISAWKARLVTPESVLATASTGVDENQARLYQAYERQMERNGAVDFDDLVTKTVQVLERFPDVLAALNDVYRYLMVDEYQDVNEAQHRLTELLGDAHGNICVTGDPDQCIYSWRGADISYILDFSERRPGARVIKLEQNYRSVGTILEAASAVIRFNSRHGDKKLWSERGPGRPIVIRRVADDVDEGLSVTRWIRELGDSGVPPSQIAVLYRLNSLSFQVESALIGAGIPYQVLQGLEFYKRKEIKDLMAWLRFTMNPSDEVSLRRIINTPARGLGEKTVGAIQDAARAMQRPLGVLLLENDAAVTAGLGTRARTAGAAFASLARRIVALDTDGVSSVIRSVLELTAYADHLKTKAATGSDPLGNVNQLVAHAARFDALQCGRGLAGFLEEVALVSEADQRDEDAEKVTLMTVHASKGLEFRHVAVVGMDRNLFPHQRQFGSFTDEEEERRLFYVAMTRAMDGLHLLTADMRSRFGSRQPSTPSVFLSEIPEALTEVVDDVSGRWGSNVTSGVTYEREDAGAADEDDFAGSRRGARVFHADHGDGTVAKVKGRGAEARVIVEFDSGDVRQFVLRYSELRSAE